MNIEFRMPNLTAKDSPGQIKQLHGFLRQTIEQLNWAMQAMNTGNVEVVNAQGQAGSGRTQFAPTESAAVAASNFDTIKKLIIKSADIVEAYATRIDELYFASGSYSADSPFGSYRMDVENRLTANQDGLTQYMSKTEAVENAIKEQKSYIQYGMVGTTLDETGSAKDDAAGIEIGYFSDLADESGTHTDQRFARFTAFGLELFGASKEAPIATFSGNKMKITNAEVVNLEITGTLRMGGYLIDRSNGLAFKWVEGSE